MGVLRTQRILPAYTLRMRMHLLPACNLDCTLRIFAPQWIVLQMYTTRRRPFLSLRLELKLESMPIIESVIFNVVLNLYSSCREDSHWLPIPGAASASNSPFVLLYQLLMITQICSVPPLRVGSTQSFKFHFVLHSAPSHHLFVKDGLWYSVMS